MAELFGFKFEKIKDSGSQEKFTEPSSEDGTLEVAGGGFYGQLLDICILSLQALVSNLLNRRQGRRYYG